MFFTSMHVVIQRLKFHNKKFAPCCMNIKKTQFSSAWGSILLLVDGGKINEKISMWLFLLSNLTQSLRRWQKYTDSHMIMEAWKCNKTICLALRSSFWRCKSNIRSGCKDIKNVSSWMHKCSSWKMLWA